MKRTLGIILLLTSAASGSILLQLEAQPSLPWSRQYSTALTRAAEYGQPLLVYLYTDWCTYCAAMERKTFSSPQLIEEMGPRFQWVKLNAEADPDGIRLRDEHGVSNYPSIFLLNPEGREVDRLTGFMEPAKFQEQVDFFLYGPASLLALERAVVDDPGSVEAHYRLGEKYLVRGKYAEAVRHFSRVIELDPTNQQQTTDASLYYLALARASAGLNRPALEAARQLEERFPESGFVPDGAILAGRIHYYAGDREEAREIFNRYLERFQNHHSQAWVRQLVSEIEREIFLAAASHD